MADDIVIIDYGMANLRSVQKAFEAVGFPAVVSSDVHRIADATKLVLPGVGAFCDAITQLRKSGLADAVVNHISEGLPFLGICLGYQMLFTRSWEGGLHAGLDLFPGEVVRFQDAPGLKVPHMGWNTLRVKKPECPLLQGLPPEPAFYFVHGYYPQIADASLVAAEADYPDAFPAMLWAGNVYATQFHPEKSQRDGLQLLRNFAQLS